MPPGAVLAKLDTWTIVERTSKQEASFALGLDLRELGLQDVDELGTCSSLAVALVSSNLLEDLSKGLFACSRLRKLDISKNKLAGLPTRDMWAKLPALVVLYLHDNEIGSLHTIGELVGLPSLVRLTLFDNPCAKHPSYRHYCVNSFLSLRALDTHVISDEELIEGATFSELLGTKCPAAALPLFGPGPPASRAQPARDEELVLELRKELAMLNHTHARLSPVLMLQAVARRIEPRRQLQRLRAEQQRHVDNATRQADMLATIAAEDAATAGGAAHPPIDQIDVDDAKTLLHRERAAIVVQARVRGAETRKSLTGKIEGSALHHDANMTAAPFLYVQTRHVHELEALLPGALGSTVSQQCHFEPTDCYTIRHPTDFPTKLSDPPIGGLLIRQRAMHPEPTRLRLTPSPEEVVMLGKHTRRFARPSRVDVKSIRAALEFADREHDSGVQAAYARRQLVRLVVPDPKYFETVFKAAERRNTHLLSSMGLGHENQTSPKVLAELLIPLTPAVLDVVLATVTLQRVWRSIACRSKLEPSLTGRLLRLRAAVRMQRWWRWWLFKERFAMLSLVRERVLATNSNKLYIPTVLLEDLRGKMPLHAAELWPEHSSLKFTFSHSHEQALQYFVTANALRPEMPLWAAPRMPIAQARSLNHPQEPSSLLQVGVRTALAPRAQLGVYVRRDWTCIAFLSTLEASRRVALLTAIAYEPLAHRTRHGRLQGTYFAPIHLFTFAEVQRWEAACFIQAAEAARKERYAFVEMLHIARERRRLEADRRARERDTNSLFAQKGEIDVEGTVAPPDPSLRRVEAPSASYLNLSKEQLERMCEGQAQVLGVYGLPPMVASNEEIGRALSEGVVRSAKEQREASAAGKVLMRERRAAELIGMRESMAIAKGGASGYGSDDGGGEGASPGSERGPHGYNPHPPADGGPMQPPSARALMMMMASVVASRQDAAEDVAAQHARYTQAKVEQASAMRAELKQAHAELLADKELERQELLVQSRLERRQLQHALDERNRAIAAEVHQKHDLRRSTKDSLVARATSRSFTGSFVRQQNAMVRQLQLGDLRRRKEEEELKISATAETARREQEAWKNRAAAEARNRGEALREGLRRDRKELAAKREVHEATRQRELDMVRLKQTQLREIRAMLSQPLDYHAAGPLGSGPLPNTPATHASYGLSDKDPMIPTPR